MVILNEKQYVLKCIYDYSLGDDVYRTLYLMANYYRQYKGYKKHKIIETLREYMAINYENYYKDKVRWNEIIESVTDKTKHRKMIEVNDVVITKSEIDKINELKVKSDRKIMFAYLCYAKYRNKIKQENNSWVGDITKDIFKSCRVQSSVNERYKTLGKLKDLGYLETSKSNTNLSVRVTFVDNESDPVLTVSDFTELGYEYLNYMGENFTRCQECGVLFKRNKNNTKKYCNKCIGYTPMESKLITCVDCGKMVKIDARLMNKCRCEDCQNIYRNNYQKELMRKRRKENKC